ncbi:MGMT family protein [Vicingaceae bacterium]|nr:MGMT family protein [Vicingaceae bacterium]MDB4082699.1 MGMT family protein [Vicingaceae bacterium]MDB9964294.1 MGMT family protein [Vicingaceae bacterium]MDC0004855.1 MGMT family protein [bacterium]MDC1452003.1 MGMT family protein [Vicingaceae bacterium]
MPNNSIKITEKNKDYFDSVFQVVRLIPEGRATSYGAISNYLGTKSGARMIGWAMNASHSQKEYVPAHRVVNRNGMLTGKHHFPSPIAMQEALEGEGVEIKDDKIQNYKQVYWDPTVELTFD